MTNKSKNIYLDYAATTPVDRKVVKAMLPFLTERFGNSVSLHSVGQTASQALEKSRKTMAEFIGARPEEIIFTSSATESNNLAIKGITFANRYKGKHLIISAIEHDCVLNSAKWLEKQGFTISYLRVDKSGLVDMDQLKRTIRPDTILISVMHANNEIGTIQPIAEIGRACRQKGVYFHTDAAQTLGKIPIDMQKIPIDLLTGSAHKMYGPKGAALLYIRKGVNIEPWLHGGGHEFGFRSSTVNVPAIVGFAKAMEICGQEMDQETTRLTKLRHQLISGVLNRIPNSQLNGHPQKRLSNNANFSFAYVEGESIVTELDFYGISTSTASACASAKLQPSHVLVACGVKPELVHGSLRVSLGRFTRETDIDYLVKVLPKVIAKLRQFSPFKG